MDYIIQRPKECSLVAICNLNGLSQAAYEALSDKVRRKHGVLEAGTRFKQQFRWIAYGIRLCKQAGLQVPDGFIASSSCGQFPAGRDADFAGKGIATVTLFAKRCRKPSGRHALAFENGELIESDGKRYASWDAYVAAVRAGGKVHRVRIDKIFNS